VAESRLLLVTTSFPESGDGSEAAGGFVLDTALALARHIPVHVVAPGLRGGESYIATGLSVTRFAVPRLPLSTLRLTRPGDALAMARTLWAGRATVRRAARAFHPDHILALWGLPSGAWARSAARTLGIPYSVWTLGSDIWSLGRIPVVRAILARVLRGARRVYADGHELAEATERIGKRPCAFLPSARALSAPPRTDWRTRAPYRLAFVGRWHVNKGPDLLLEALALLGDDDWARIERFEFCGGGGMQALIDEARAYFERARRPFVLRGYLDRTDFQALLARTDILVLPSRIESIPVIFSDAMQHGCAMISTPVGDMSRLFSTYRVGWLAEAATPQALAAALRACLSDDVAARREEIASAAQAFDIEAIAMRLGHELVDA
jgi:glycosyltransferase involved in cell wall biosynthesis